jgi:hypothetical protein
VPLVLATLIFTGRAEGLTGTGAGPRGSVVGPSGEAQGEGPPADAGEEMALAVSGQVGRSNIDN